jgi:tetratricopeptide (TPR) repeat protein
MLGIIYTGIGQAHQVRHEPDEAMRWHRRAHTLYEQAAATDPGYYRDWLAFGLITMGKLESGRGRYDEAARCFRDAVSILEPLVKSNAAIDVTEVRGSLASAYDLLGEALKVRGQADDALRCFERAHEVREELAEANPGSSNHQLRLSVAKIALAAAQRKRAQPSEAERLLHEALALLERLPRDRFTLECQARCHALLSAVVVDQQQRIRHADLALQFLVQAIAAGFTDLGGIKEGEDFEPLRERAVYQKAVRDLELRVKSDTK